MHVVNVKGVGALEFDDEVSIDEIKAYLDNQYSDKSGMSHTQFDNNQIRSEEGRDSMEYLSKIIRGEIASNGFKNIAKIINESGENPAGLLEIFGAGTVAKKAGSIGKDVVSKYLGSGSERIDRAKEMGFMTDMPLYHGTNKDFDKFQLFEGEDLTRSVSRSPVGKLGVSLAIEPRLANEFANRAGGEGMNVMPVMHRAENPVSLDLEGTETNEEIFATVVDAWNRGFDSIKFNNYTTKEGGSGQSFVLVKDPNQVRSVNADFDPKKKLSPELLAGFAGASIISGAALNDMSEGTGADAINKDQLRARVN